MKKDQDYIVKLEKAIAQKYGKEAIQNPVSNWDEIKEKDYLQQLKDLTDKEKVIESKAEKVQRNGFFVSKKLSPMTSILIILLPVDVKDCPFTGKKVLRFEVEEIARGRCDI